LYVALALATTVLIGQSSVYGQVPVGSEFTYQGQLKDGGIPADGNYDFVFRLYDADTGGVQVGSDVTVDDWPVAGGLFTLQLDFGAGAFDSNARWIEIDVRDGDPGAPYTTLSPRQPVTAAPVALYALDGPGSAGYWAENGTAIYNTNSGGVGIGTASPNFNLHVFEAGSGGFCPPARLGTQWYLFSLPDPQNDWFTIEVGGDLTMPGWGPGTRLIRESGTALHFQTEDEMNSAFSTTQMTLDAAGNLGIGTTEPIAMLEAVSDTGTHGIRATTSAIPVAAIRTSTSGTWPAIHAECASLSSNATAIRAYITDTSPGSGSAAVSGHNYGTTWNGYGVKGSHAGYGIGVYGVSANGTGVYGESTNGGYAGYFAGTVSVNVLEISGADLAEKFPVSEKVEPGLVVAIDPRHPGQLCLARGAYNRCVAGVVSGANGLSAGAVLGHLPGHEDAPPIALSGRVWVHCDATEQPITPGDLLTTSTTPGHAMKVTDHTRAQGAVIGKAMTALHSERGLVLVLVSLQ
jgi:hypothetical protein